mgnify:CR=1 FL=1
MFLVEKIYLRILELIIKKKLKAILVIEEIYVRICGKLFRNSPLDIHYRRAGMYFQSKKAINPAQGKYFEELPKVFVIGHHKTGTYSISKLFKNNGYKSFHCEQGRLAKKIIENFQNCHSLLYEIEDVHLYSDIEFVGNLYAYTLFPLLDLQYPGSYFIYNFRNIDNWIKSRIKHDNGLYAKECLRILKSYYPSIKSEDLLIKHWKNFYIMHENSVKKYFANKDNLIQVDLDSQKSKENLCKKLKEIGFSLKEDSLPRDNITLTKK